MEQSKEQVIANAVGMTLSHFYVINIARNTLFPGWYLVPLYIGIFLFLRFFLIDKLLELDVIKESYAMRVFLFTPILFIGFFYMINSIPLNGKMQFYEKEIIDFSIVKQYSKRNAPQRTYLLSVILEDKKESIKITGSQMNVANNVDHEKEYPYIQFNARKGLFGFYLIDLENHVIYNW